MVACLCVHEACACMCVQVYRCAWMYKYGFKFMGMYVLCMYAFLQGFLLKAIIYNLMVSCESSLAVVMPGVCGT